MYGNYQPGTRNDKDYLTLRQVRMIIQGGPGTNRVIIAHVMRYFFGDLRRKMSHIGERQVAQQGCRENNRFVNR